MAPWRKRLFIATSHITADAAGHFGLPLDRTVIVGSRIEVELSRVIPNCVFIHRLGLSCWFRAGSVDSVESMFDSLVTAALCGRSADAVGAWARVENAACARRLSAMADELDAMFAADGSDEREQWCLDNWDAVAASVAAAQNVSLGVAAHQLLVADALRLRLPRVAEVFAAGAINYRMVAAIVSRTRLDRRPRCAGEGGH